MSESTPLRICTVVGARPQYIKARAVSTAIATHNRTSRENALQEILVNTGQHYDYELSRLIFEELELPPPAYDLEVGSASHGAQTGRVLEAVESVLLREQPHLVVVYGDTNSTLAGALAAAKLDIPVAHVEAGMRCGRRAMAEEVNRVLTDHLATLLFCPTEQSAANLRREGIATGVHITGDVMLDNLLYLESRLDTLAGPLLAQLGLRPRQYRLATVHRAENTDDEARLRQILAAFEELASDGVSVFLPLHPRTKDRMDRLGIVPGVGVVATQPVGYLEMLALQRNARLVLTDSGGMQKEAYMQKIPCVTLRDETEWTETVQAGWNTLVGADARVIVGAARRVEKNPPWE